MIVSSAGLELDAQLAAHRDMYPWLRQYAAKGAYMAGLCAGSADLAEAGLPGRLRGSAAIAAARR
jgi:transcriptional regulator GlxA family with amidase domain